MKSKKDTKVLMCMSGGVDSSVAAHLLLEEGYQVVGAFMKQWTDSSDVSGVCTWKEDRRDAIRVASFLGIPLLTLDFEKEYKEMVMGYMFKEYALGRTPNPDVMCNKWIKFGFWLEKAEELGFDKIATGHYAHISLTQVNKYELIAAKDTEKDQTYFLHQLDQKQLSQTIFPLGNFTKDEVREVARKIHIPTAEKDESMGICFVGEVPMQDFLKQKIPTTPGDIIHAKTGEILGQHNGLPFYTIGQRHGVVQKGGDEPLFVVQKRQESNTLVVGYQDDPLLVSNEVVVENIHWVSGQSPTFPLQCKVRLRHRQVLQEVQLEYKKGQHVLQFSTPQKAITPGQFAVLYSENTCLGGGVVK